MGATIRVAQPHSQHGGHEGSESEEGKHHRRDGGCDESHEGDEGSQGEEDEHNRRDGGGDESYEGHESGKSLRAADAHPKLIAVCRVRDVFSCVRCVCMAVLVLCSSSSHVLCA